MASQEWQEGHDHAVAGHPHWNNPHVAEFDGGDRLRPYDWLAGWSVGSAELLIAPNPIPMSSDQMADQAMNAAFSEAVA